MGADFDVHSFLITDGETPAKNACHGGTVYELHGCGNCQSWELSPLTCFGKTCGLHILMRCWNIPVWAVPAFRCCTYFEQEDEAIYCGLNMVPSVNVRVKLAKEEGGEPEVYVWGNTKCAMRKTHTPPEAQSMDHERM